MNVTTQPQTPPNISGVYPHLCAYTYEPGEVPPEISECGIGALVPWADRLWMITYAAHRPKGSSHKLYSIDQDKNLTIHPESVGGTPAARMIHTESNQLLLGHYVIDAEGSIRVISPEVMPGRLTAIARHLSHPETMVYYVDMEGMVYEANVHTLEVTKLFHKPVPGWHAKGAYTSQGRLVMSNNGEHPAFKNAEEHFLVEDHPENPERAGVLAEWDGETWSILERRQFTEVTGPGGIHGAPDDQSPLWSIGWDRRSLRLKLLDGGEWRTFLLPKAAHNNDPQHGWFTEWPRIRDIGNGRMMMDMHGMFYEFPKTFSAANTAGIKPISSHLRYIPDFCDWDGQLVIATDEASRMHNDMCGQPQSNLWFGSVEGLKSWGPRSGYGGPWVDDVVEAGVASDPFLIAGFDGRVLHLVTDKAAKVTVEIDTTGANEWTVFEILNVDGKATLTFPADLNAEWMRVTSDTSCTATAYFHGTDSNQLDVNGNLFAGLADVGEAAEGGLIGPSGEHRGLHLLQQSGVSFDVSRTFEFLPGTISEVHANALKLEPVYEVDEASVKVTDGTTTFRLPKGPEAFDATVGILLGVREMESERNLANLHGTFYEVPRSNFKVDPDWERMRPVSSHAKQIQDYCTWQGLLTLTGVSPCAVADGHIFRGPEGGAIWCGAIDDLWQLGKPVGVGGPWKDTTVKAGEPSDPYLMTGYDEKTLTLTADRDVTMTLEINVDHQSGWHRYETITLKAGEQATHTFPEAFSAHWIRCIADQDCVATAWLEYR
jgi:hypothetical protein